MKYRDYSSIEFANDGFFIRWVKNPDEESDWFWTSFMKEHPGSIPEIEEARELITRVGFHKHELSDDALHSMRNNILMVLRTEIEEEKEHRPAPRQTRMRKWRSNWLKVAAALIAAPLIYWGAIDFAGDRDNQISAFAGEDESVLEKKINREGQKSVVFLHDGTKVWLNASSKIAYLKGFGERGTRDVYLEGEAFFEVTHDVDKPFIVHTTSIKIKVLGTSFNVKSYSTEKTIETTLVAGKVRIEQSDLKGNRVGDVELKPNQRAVFNKESKVIKIKEVAAANSANWKQERLVFDGVTIDEALLQMEKWFNVKIHVEKNGALDCRLTATIEKETLSEVLALLQASHNVTYRIEGKDVFIKGPICKVDEK